MENLVNKETAIKRAYQNFQNITRTMIKRLKTEEYLNSQGGP